MRKMRAAARLCAIAASSLTAVGCAGGSSTTATVVARERSVPIATPSPNLVLLAAERGVTLDAEEGEPHAGRNDASLGRAAVGGFREVVVDRRVWDRDSVVSGRTTARYRAVTRQREWSTQ